MKENFFDTSLSFRELVLQLEQIKVQIHTQIKSYSNSDRAARSTFLLHIHNSIYALPFEEWRCDRIIEYIYDDIPIDVLKKISRITN